MTSWTLSVLIVGFIDPPPEKKEKKFSFLLRKGGFSSNYITRLKVLTPYNFDLGSHELLWLTNLLKSLLPPSRSPSCIQRRWQNNSMAGQVCVGDCVHVTSSPIHLIPNPSIPSLAANSSWTQASTAVENLNCCAAQP